MRTRCLNIKSFFVAIAILLLNQRVAAEMPITFLTEIQLACSVVGQSKNPKIKILDSLCACIAKNHFESATHNTSEVQATADLKWILQLYRMKDPKRIMEYSKSNEALFEYDFEVAEKCQN